MNRTNKYCSRRITPILRAMLLAILCAMAYSSAMAFDETTDVELTGKILSTGTATMAENAFDADAATYYRTTAADMQWVGLDLGARHVVTRISYTPAPLSVGPDRMLLSLFEGANDSTFMDAVPLYLISEAPTAGKSTTVDINVSRGFRYVRYVGGAGSYCNVAELQFFGHEGEGDDSRFYQVTNLPTLSIHVADGAVPTVRGEDFESRYTLIHEGGTMIQEYPILTRVRGNFSATPPNKPYRVKFNDGKSHHIMKGSTTNESPVKAKKWVLLNSYRDKTLMRNPVAWQVSKRVGPKFTPWNQPVDLILNGDYRGTYTIADQVTVHSGRIDITEMYEEDIEGEALTGGYFVEVDNNARREPYNFTTRHGNPISVHDPDDDIMQPEQFAYIKTAFNDMEDIVFGDDYADTDKGFRSVLDLESFLKYFLISEFNGNTDMICQVFMYKDRGDDHFYTGPVWDHELALDDDATVYPGNSREDWTYLVRETGRWGTFVSRILSDPNAMAQLRQLWARLRDEGAFNSLDVAGGVDSLRNEMRASANLNFIRWPYLNQYISLTPAIRGSWEAEVDVVRDYVRDRVAWMDKKLGYDALTEEDGIYQIGTPRDLCLFSELVANGNTSAPAVLCADIDMEAYSDRFKPIGNPTKPYCGQFDGQGHTISNLRVEGSNYVGLFGIVGAGMSLRDVNIAASCSFSGSNYVSAFIGQVRNGIINIQGCSSAATVTASGTYAAGLVGMSRLLATLNISNCYNVGAVKAAENGASLVGPSAGKISLANCYNAAIVSTGGDGDCFASTTKDLSLANCHDIMPSKARSITPLQVASGELCFILNAEAGYSYWRQNLDNGLAHDPYPTPSPSSAQVYRTSTGYTNTPRNGVKGYRYYKLCITRIRDGNSGTIQFSEFDLLDNAGGEVEDLSIYAGTESNISGENWDNLTDNRTSTKYCSGKFNGNACFFFDAGKAIPVSGYRIYSANDSRQYSDRNPSTWTLCASNVSTSDPDDPSWVEIDIRKDITEIGTENFTPYDYSLSSPVGEVTDIVLSHGECTLEEGDTLRLEAVVKPDYMSDAGLFWKSTDPGVVRVDQWGLIKAVAEGQASVQVSAPGWGSAMGTCVVGVVKPSYLLGDVNADGEVDGLDLVALVNVVRGTSSLACDKRAADIDGDGIIGEADIAGLVGLILLEGQ